MSHQLYFHLMKSLLPLHSVPTKRSDYGIHQQESNVEFWKVIPVGSIQLGFHPMESSLPLHPTMMRSDYGIHQQENNVEFWKVIPILSSLLCFHPMESLLPLHPGMIKQTQAEQRSRHALAKVLPLHLRDSHHSTTLYPNCKIDWPLSVSPCNVLLWHNYSLWLVSYKAGFHKRWLRRIWNEVGDHCTEEGVHVE